MRAGIREELDGCDTRNDEPKTNQGGSIQLLAIEKPCDEGDQDDAKPGPHGIGNADRYIFEAK